MGNWLSSSKIDFSYLFLKLQVWNHEHRLLTPCGSDRNCIQGANFQYDLFSCISKRTVSPKKNILVGFSLDFLLPYILCYILLHYFNIYTTLKVFSFQWYQLLYMHILASGSELQVIYFGHVIQTGSGEKRVLALRT